MNRFVTTISIILISSFLQGQVLIPSITIDSKRLDSNQGRNVDNLKEAILSYIEMTSFSNEDYNYELAFHITIFIENVDDQSGETRYTCQAFFTNENDQRYVETSWKFPFNPGNSIYRSGIFDPIGGMIDFYGYLIVANELDGIEINGGNGIFSKAQEIIEMAKSSKYGSGWAGKQKTLDKITSNFRLRKARLKMNETFWAIEDDDFKNSKITLNEALKLLEETIYLNSKDKYTRIFIESHYKDVDYFADVFQDTFFIPAYRRLSPGNTSYFDKIVKNFK